MGIDSLLSNKNATMKQLLLPFLFFFSLACGPTVVVNITDGGGSGGETDGSMSTTTFDGGTTVPDSASGNPSGPTAGTDTEGPTETSMETGVMNTDFSGGSTTATVEPGTLSISAEGSPPSAIILDDAVSHVGRYRLSASGNEGFDITRLQVIHDEDAAFDMPTSSFAIQHIIIRYPNERGVMQEASTSLSASGSAQFAGLNLFIPAGEDVIVEIYAETFNIDQIGPSLSGEEIRLGLRSVNNNPTTFLAVGRLSGTEIFEPTIDNDDDVQAFVVRASVPRFSQESIPLVLEDGLDLACHRFIAASEGGTVDLIKLSYDLEIVDAGADDDPLRLWRVRLFRNGVNVIGDVDIFNTSLTSLDAGSHRITITWNESNYINTPAEYTLMILPNGVSSGDSVTTELVHEDDFSGHLFDNSLYNQNTGYLLGDTPDDSMFTAYHDYLTHVVSEVGRPANTVWSDTWGGNDEHSYVPAFHVSWDYAGSPSFTNGRWLGINNELDPVILTAP